MDEFEVERHADPALDAPVLVEGLPGVGHVGKLAAEHLLEEFESERVATVYSEHFPPQVTVEDGIASLAAAEFHAVDADGTDLLVLTGDHQAGDGPGHYRTASLFLDIAAEFGCERAYALGGVPTGELIEEYAVVGAVNDEALLEPMESVDVEFRDDEPAGGVVGISGLVLGLGERRGLPAGCLMGETSGYLVDPKSARAVLEALGELVGFDVDYASLEERADEMEEVMEKMQEMQAAQAPSEDDLRYIG
ncbi:proteasome assembly chaperone family protein [Halosegnis marinus]|uniref:Proteasome assembly chaperone family protein n=1 Tax=Halosegnis marinus TaxID=3034023 RepID=A0ABD5ZR11_9EURY|nr:proteasome assembly chaperone family protein [Halosegnis sp. DT85]